VVLGEDCEKMLVDKREINLPAFQDSMPRSNWARSFMERHEHVLTVITYQNIKCSRASVFRKNSKAVF